MQRQTTLRAITDEFHLCITRLSEAKILPPRFLYHTLEYLRGGARRRTKSTKVHLIQHSFRLQQTAERFIAVCYGRRAVQGG